MIHGPWCTTLDGVEALFRDVLPITIGAAPLGQCPNPTTLLNGHLMQASFPVREIGTVLTLLHARYELEDLIRMEHFQG